MKNIKTNGKLFLINLQRINMLLYFLIMKYFGYHKEKGGYWYSFRNMFIVLFIPGLIGIPLGLIDKEYSIGWEGVLSTIILAILIYVFNLMRKRKISVSR